MRKIGVKAGIRQSRIGGREAYVRGHRARINTSKQKKTAKKSIRVS